MRSVPGLGGNNKPLAIIGCKHETLHIETKMNPMPDGRINLLFQIQCKACGKRFVITGIPFKELGVMLNAQMLSIIVEPEKES